MNKILILLWTIIVYAACQIWPASYDQKFEQVNFDYNFTNDASRTIEHIILSPDSSSMYGVARGNDIGLTSTEFIFRLDTDMNFQWIKSLTELFNSSFSFEIDSTGTYLYFNFDSSTCAFVRMKASDGTLDYAKDTSSVVFWGHTRLSQDEQYIYSIYDEGTQPFIPIAMSNYHIYLKN